MKASIKQISEITGFSPATISNALNHKKGVNQKTAERIFQVAKEIGYISENKITKIKLVIYKRNGLIIDDSPFFPILLKGVENECRASGYEMVICNVDRNDPDYEEQVKLILNDTSSAILLLGTEMMDGDLSLYRNASCPVLLLDHWTESMDFNSVLINNADAARAITEHLLDNGHREVGYLRGNYRIKAFRSRFIGFQTALKKYKVPYKEEYTVTVGTYMSTACQDMLEYLKKKPKLPTAFFADNDIIALGAMKALQEMGYRIPEDISIVGFDDLTFSEISSPPLTTLRVEKREMGKMAVRRLVELIDGIGTSTVTKIQVCPKIIYRNTVKNIK